MAFLARSRIPLFDVPIIEKSKMRKIESFDITKIKQAEPTESKQYNQGAAFKAYRPSSAQTKLKGHGK